MIVFDLCCTAGDHRFEAWFASSDSFADQQARGLIACPVCGDAEVRKAVMAPRVGAKSNQQVAPPVPAKPASEIATADPTPEQVRKLLAHITGKQAEMPPQTRRVGRAFEAAAHALHEGRAARHEQK